MQFLAVLQKQPFHLRKLFAEYCMRYWMCPSGGVKCPLSSCYICLCILLFYKSSKNACNHNISILFCLSFMHVQNCAAVHQYFGTCLGLINIALSLLKFLLFIDASCVLFIHLYICRYEIAGVSWSSKINFFYACFVTFDFLSNPFQTLHFNCNPRFLVRLFFLLPNFNWTNGLHEIRFYCSVSNIGFELFYLNYLPCFQYHWIIHHLHLVDWSNSSS